MRRAARWGRGPGAAGAVVAAAFVLRLVSLARLPPGLFVDEAYTGYDALSVLHTGRDLWGRWFPLYFSSWGGDAVEGLYRYLCLPFLAILGPIPLAARLPAALAGGATVWMTYLLGRRLLGVWPGVVAAALLAVSPWHLHFSRIAFRGILLPAAAVGAAWLAAQAAGLMPPGEEDGPRRPRRWFACAAFLGVGLYTYSVAKLFVPVFCLLLAWLFRGEIRRRRAGAAMVLLLVAVLAVPAVRETVAGRGQVRFEQISALRPEVLDETADRLRREHPWLGRAAGSRLVAGLWVVAGNYASHFGPRFLLTDGDRNLRHSVPGVGQLLWIEGLLMGAGLLRAARRRSPVDLGMVGWLLVGPLADSFTTDRVPNALRALAMVPAPQLLAASGAAAIWAILRRRPRPFVIVAFVAAGLALAGESARYLASYAGPYAAESAPYWNAGYPEGIRSLVRESPAGATLMVARPEDWRVRRYGLNPYFHSLILFYGEIPPRQFQEDGMGRWSVTRIPERGLVRPAELPRGARMLVPAERVDPADVVRWIAGPDGRPILAVLAGSDGG